MLDRAERQDRIARELEAKARKLNGRVASHLVSRSALLDEVPDLIEYPAVIAGIVQEEFLKLPPEVLTTTLVHHQHYFPVVDDAGHLKNAFLAVTNTDSANEKIVSRNAERVVAARLRDARFFWETDRGTTLEERVERLDTLVFHRKLGTYRAKAERVASLAAWVASDALELPETANDSRTAGRLAKADLVTDMVREFPELQGTMGGIYAREEGHPESVWKAIYFHYLPASIEVDAPPSRQELGAGAVPWAAVSLADKLDTLVGMFSAGERPTGSRDPYGLRRQAHGLLRVLVDLPGLTGLRSRPTLGPLIAQAVRGFSESGMTPDGLATLWAFLLERYRYVLEQRGFEVRNVRAVVHEDSVQQLNPLSARLELEALPEFTESPDFRQLAVAFKRVRNIARELPDADFADADGSRALVSLPEPAEQALLAEIDQRQPRIEQVLNSGENYRAALAEAAKFGPAVDRFFTEVFVMVDDARLRTARLRLMKRLERLILRLADISEIVPQSES